MRGLLIALALAAGVATGCRVSTPAPGVTEEPIAGVDDTVGPAVDLGDVPALGGGTIAVRGFRNEAGGVCLDEGDGRAPICSPEIELHRGPEIAVSRYDQGRACAYVFAPLDTASVSLAVEGVVHELQSASGSEPLGMRVFAGCYDDEPPLGEQELRHTTQDGEEHPSS